MLSFKRSASSTSRKKPPILLKYRSSVYYIAAVTGVGLFTDVCLYPLYTPAIPFRLRDLGYTNISSLTGWLAAAYAAGLIVATFPFAWLGSRVRSKRNLLLAAVTLFMVGIVMFLAVSNYAGMVVARFVQGASGAGIWTLGLALVADNVDKAQMGKMMGLAMIGYSFGTSIGQPVGGLLYANLGWIAPSVFALILRECLLFFGDRALSVSAVGFDFVLRLLVVEKFEAWRWQADASEPLQDVSVTASPESRPANVDEADKDKIAITDEMRAQAEAGLMAPSGLPSDAKSAKIKYDSIAAIRYLLFRLKSLTPLLVSFLNGFIFSSERCFVAVLNLTDVLAGIYNTALVLRLNQRYGLDSEGAGLVFFAVAIPAAIISPISGWLTDKFGWRPLSTLCCLLFVPALCLLVIEQLPLPAFIVLLSLCGCCSGLINTPVMACLANVAETSGGICGTSHTFGAFNLTFSLAAFVGPIVAGQVLEVLGVATGFKVIVGMAAALSLLLAPMAWVYMRK